MPEDLGETPLKIGDKYRQLRQEGTVFNKSDIRKLVESYGIEFIGTGSECVVVGTEDKPEKVIAINYRNLSPETAIPIFYKQRVLSTLFPHNFPHFYASIAGKDNYGGTVRQRIKGTSLDQIKGKGFDADPEGKIKYPFRKVLDVCRQIGIPISIDTQDPKNFVLGQDGGVYYLDAPEEKFPGIWYQEKILEYMQRKKNDDGSAYYDEGDVQIVQRSLERIQKIEKELPLKQVSLEEVTNLSMFKAEARRITRQPIGPLIRASILPLLFEQGIFEQENAKKVFSLTAKEIPQWFSMLFPGTTGEFSVESRTDNPMFHDQYSFRLLADENDDRHEVEFVFLREGLNAGRLLWISITTEEETSKKGYYSTHKLEITPEPGLKKGQKQPCEIEEYISVQGPAHQTTQNGLNGLYLGVAVTLDDRLYTANGIKPGYFHMITQLFDEKSGEPLGEEEPTQIVSEIQGDRSQRQQLADLFPPDLTLCGVCKKIDLAKKRLFSF